MTDSILAFVQYQWLYVIAAFVAIVVVFTVFKHVLRWVVIIAIALGLIYVGMEYGDTELLQQGKKLVEQTAQYTKEQAINEIANEVKDARYTLKADGQYEVKTANFLLRGQVGQPDAVLVFKDQEFPVQIGDQLTGVIEQAKQNSSANQPAP
jgi:energy-coupling factor transporter transmembrane protein EcfT